MSDFVKVNYHAHTFRCHHASGTEREYIEAAIDMGIKKFGFSDHIPCPFAGDYVSHIRMRMQEAPGYVQTIRELAKEYKNDIELFVGFEAEYIPEFYEKQIAMCRQLDVDYLILGQHFLQSEVKGPYSGAPTQDEARIRAYVDSVIAAAKTGSFSYIAHPDLINYQGMDSVYEWEMGRLCKAMKEENIPLEINMLGYGEGKHYPNPKFWKIVKEYGNDVILGVDAHCIANIRNYDAYDACMKIAEENSLNLVDDVTLRKNW